MPRPDGAGSLAPGRREAERRLAAGRRLTAVEAGRDDGDPHLVAERVVDDRAEDDVGLRVGGLADQLGGLVDLSRREILRKLFASLAKNWMRILFVALAVTGLAFGFAWLATPHYKAETRLLIETRESVFTRPASGDANRCPILDEEGVTSQVEVICSTDILKQVAQKLDLRKLPEFDDAADMSMFGRLAGHRRPEQRSERDPARRARAEDVPREAQRLSGREVARHRHRVLLGRPGARRRRSRTPSPTPIWRSSADAKLQSNSDATDWLAARDRRPVEAREGSGGARRRISARSPTS